MPEPETAIDGATAPNNERLRLLWRTQSAPQIDKGQGQSLCSGKRVGMVNMWRDLGTFKIAGKPVTLSVLTGTVLDTNEIRETVVTGSGKIDTAVQGYPTGTIDVSSRTIISRDLYLLDTEGKEHELTFKAEVRLRAGHKISVFALQSDLSRAFITGGDRAFYKMRNHSTSTDSLVVPPYIVGGPKTGLLWGLVASGILWALLTLQGYGLIGAFFAAFVIPGIVIWAMGALFGSFVLAPRRMKALNIEFKKLAASIVE